MGFDLHITRKEHWFDEVGLAITRDEWMALMAADPSIRIDRENCNEDPPNIFSVWDDPNSPAGIFWINWTERGVSARHQGKHFVRKVHEIATKLGATVQGDDGEVYLRDGSLDWNDQRTRDSTPQRPPLGWRLRRIFKR